jgi:hypothetical protein
MKKFIIFAFLLSLSLPSNARLSPAPVMATMEEPIALGICPNGGTLERLGTCDNKGKKGHENCYLTSGGCCHKGKGGDDHPVEEVEVSHEALQDALIKVEDDIETLRGMIDLLQAK